jgi:SIR2-like domain
MRHNASGRKYEIQQSQTHLQEMKIKNTRWRMLQERYNKRGIALVLGAGVSYNCNLPDWAGLLRGMARSVVGKQNALIDELISAGWSLPSIASVIDASRRNITFRELIRGSLYQKFPFRTPANTKEQQKKLVAYVDQSNSTMRAVASLCATRENGRVVGNRRVMALVNFNLDSVLRSYSRAKYREWLFRTVESAGITTQPDRIPIYQMHGLIPFYTKKTEETAAPEGLVMTEQQYFDFFNRPTSVFNYTFLYLLREYNCLFIGMSMRDDNIRRLLHYSTSERRSSGRIPNDKANRLRTGLRHFAMLRRSGSPDVDQCTETSLRAIGTRVLWLRDFDEIAIRLGSLYESAGGNWADVY